MESLSILVPTYNEEAYIKKLLEELIELDLTSFTPQVDIWVIDDASTDRS